MSAPEASKVQLQAGKWYRTRQGARALLDSDQNASQNKKPLYWGTVFRSGMIERGRVCWGVDGSRFMSGNQNDLVEESHAPFTTWMCHVGEQAPMPAPSEKIAREWAQRSGGRAFRVMEVIE